MREPWQEPDPLAPQRAVASAIQDLVAARLGRGFIPLAVLFSLGVVQLLAGHGGVPALLLALGAVATAGTMLAYGLRIVQRAFLRPMRAWMSLAMIGGLVPLAFALYVLGWRGLRLLTAGEGIRGFAAGLSFTVMGTWVMRAWMKVVEVERLARFMVFDVGETGG